MARGRNIFPKEQHRGRGGRVNNLFKRFQAQHRDKLGEPEGDLLYDGFDTVKSRRERTSRTRTRTRSRSRGRNDRRSRKRSASSSSDSSRSSSSSEDSDAHKKKKRKIKKEKKEKKDKKKKKEKKKKESAKKKKKDKESSSDSEEEKKDEGGSDWRVELLKKMKDIKNLPPEELEAEFKKAMEEKRRKEQEEQCLNAIKERQKMARKVKKQAEKEAKKAEKLKAKEEKEEATEDVFYGSGDGGFYNGFEDALGRMQSLQENNQLPDEVKENPFMSSFNEVPFVPEENAEGDEMGNGGMEGGEGEELDPYARAQAEAMMRMKEERGEEVSWPAGAIENNMGMGDGEGGEMTKEEMDAQQEAMEMEANNLDDKTKDVVNTSKMFSKIRNRIKGKPLKINLKPKKSTEEGEEDPGLEPVDTPLEGLSGEEAEQFGDYEEFEEKVGLDDEYDLRQEVGMGSSRSRGVSKSGDEEEERRVARYRERARRRRERSAVEPGELEDGEHSPSPEPERPHHRRRRRRRHERREESEEAGQVLEDGEVVEASRRERRRRHRTPDEYQGPKDHGPPGVFPPSLLGPPPGFSAPPPLAVDTSVPPPSLPMVGAGALPAIGPGYGYGHGANHAPPMQPSVRPPFHPQQQPYQAQAFQGPQGANLQPLGPRPGYGPRTSPEYGARTSPDYGSRTSPTYRGPSQPPSPNYHQQTSYHPQQQHQQSLPQYNATSGPPSPRWDAYSSASGGRRAPPLDVRRHQPTMAQPEIKKESNNLFFDSLPTEAVDSAEEEEESEVDITKVSPIMKYMAGKLVEQKYHLEMAGPFAYRSDIPGLSKHLFVAYKMVTMLEEAGYTGSKMYMSAMFPAGLKDTKTELIGLVNKGKLHPGIKGSKLTKLCVRCIRCFLAYYTGKSDDIDTSDGECSDSNDEVEEEEEGANKPNKTVTTSMMDVLQRVKEEENQPGESEHGNEVAASVAGGRFSGEDNPWQTMELGMRSEKLRSFTALQSHFTKQLVGKGVDQRDAREQASDSMMCLVVADFNDASLRYMVDRWKKVILPEQSQLEVSRPRHDQTLYDQLVAKILKHRAEFPLSIIQEVQAESDPNAALTHRVRNIVERVLRFYMRGLGKVQEGKGEATTGLAAPTDPSGLQFNYLPEGLREEEGQGGSGVAANQPPSGNPTNFFNMDAAATANRQFSSYKRLSLDDPALEPVSPEHSTSFSNPSSMGGKTQFLARQKYLFGTFYVDTLLYNGSNYVYEIGVHMSDSSSCEVT